MMHANDLHKQLSGSDSSPVLEMFINFASLFLSTRLPNCFIEENNAVRVSIQALHLLINLHLLCSFYFLTMPICGILLVMFKDSGKSTSHANNRQVSTLRW